MNMSPKLVDKEKKRIQILQAAMEVFARQGFVNTKIEDITRAASIGKGTIYEYFQSKQEIFSEAYHFMFSGMEESITEHLNSTDNPEQKLVLLITSMTDFILEHRYEFAEIIMDFWAEGVRRKDPEMLKIIDLNHLYQVYRDLISQILKDGIQKGTFKECDTHSLASVLIGALDGLMLQWMIDKGSIDLRKLTQALIQSLFEGIKI